MIEPTDLQLAIFLARLHQTSTFLFWRCADWGDTHLVEVARKDEENVYVRHRILGRGTLLPPGEQHGIS